MKRLIIFGTSDAAVLAHHYFSNDGQFNVEAFVVDRAYRNEDQFLGKPLVDSESLVNAYPPSEYHAFIAVGYNGLNELRKEKFSWFKGRGYRLPGYIHPRVICNAETVGENCFIQEGAIIQPFVKLGNNVVIWSGVHIGHHSDIGDHSFFAPGACLAGRVTVGECCFIGTNATIKDHVSLAPKTLVAAGALVVGDTSHESLIKSKKAESFSLTSDTIRKL